MAVPGNKDQLELPQGWPPSRSSAFTPYRKFLFFKDCNASITLKELESFKLYVGYDVMTADDDAKYASDSELFLLAKGREFWNEKIEEYKKIPKENLPKLGSYSAGTVSDRTSIDPRASSETPVAIVPKGGLSADGPFQIAGFGPLNMFGK